MAVKELRSVITLAQTTWDGREHRFLKGNRDHPIFQGFITGLETPRGCEVVNSIASTAKTPFLHSWKQKVATVVRSNLGQAVHLEAAAVSLSFVFCPGNHGNLKLDAENFIKPVIDGAALGLFSADLDPRNHAHKIRFNADDSVFRWCFFEKQEIADRYQEGVFFTVWEVAGDKGCAKTTVSPFPAH